MEVARLFTDKDVGLRKPSENLSPWQHWAEVSYQLSSLSNVLFSSLLGFFVVVPFFVLTPPSGELSIYIPLSQQNLISGNELKCIHTKT